MANLRAIALLRNELVAAMNQRDHYEGQVAVFAAALMDAGERSESVAALAGVSRATLYRMMAKAPGQLRVTD